MAQPILVSIHQSRQRVSYLNLLIEAEENHSNTDINIAESKDLSIMRYEQSRPRP